LAEFSTVDRVVDLNLPDPLVLERLGGRRVCRNCGINYHRVFNPPQKADVCDACGGEVYTRDDDREEAIRQRIEVYREQTAPLIDYYRTRGLLVEVDAQPAAEQVVENFRKAVGV
jgi:adenylate kinase